MTDTIPAGYTTAARPTSYRGTSMRSRLEATFAQALDAAGIAWEYEPLALAGRAGQWLPDFRIASSDGSRVYVEVRPTIELAARDLGRYAQIAGECDPAALVIAAGFIDDDPLACCTPTGQAFRLAGPRQPVAVTRATLGSRAVPDTGPRYDLLPVPAAIKRRASEAARLDKITRDIAIFRTTDGRGFCRVASPVALPLLCARNSSKEPAVADAISTSYDQVYGRPPSMEKLTEHLEELTARCTIVEEVCQGAARLDEDHWILDLGPGTGPRVVTIGPTGWRLSTHSPLPLYRHGITTLPAPVPGGHADELYDLLNVHEDDFDTFVDALAYCYLPGRSGAPVTIGKGQMLRHQIQRNNAPYLESVQVGPFDYLARLVRSNERKLFPAYRSDEAEAVTVRFVSLHGADDAASRRAVETVSASAGRILGALLDRAVAILAGPRELASPVAQRALPAPATEVDPLQLILDTFPGSVVENERLISDHTLA